MNLVDLLIVAFLCLAVYDGWKAGTLVLLLDLASFLLALLAAFFLFPAVGTALGNLMRLSDGWHPFLGFALTYLVVDISLRLAANRLVKRYPAFEWKTVPSRLGGSVLNAGKQLLALFVAVNLLLFLPALPAVRAAIIGSAIAPSLVSEHPTLERAFADIIEPAVYEAQYFITTTEIDGESSTIEVPVGELATDPTAEQAMFILVNKERERRDLSLLAWDEELAVVSRLHSRDMWRRQFFAHVNPDGADPFDRLRQAGVKYLVAGENLALAPSTPIAHRGLMDSPGHRENILTPEFGSIGIGVIRNGLYGATYTQLFTE